MILIKAPVRQSDSWGSGVFGAKRGGRKHLGTDFAACPGSILISPVKGMVTRIGYPYDPADSKKGHFRLVEILTHDDMKARFLYVSPSVKPLDVINIGDELGVVQDLTTVYPGITPHVHIDVHNGNDYINPSEYLRGAK